jgi:hypothetical protein
VSGPITRIHRQVVKESKIYRMPATFYDTG